jgi:hypothetical protein
MDGKQLADIIERAADALPVTNQLSCYVVWHTMNPGRGYAGSGGVTAPFDRLFDEMGGEDWGAFDEFEPGEERQGVRYAWLNLMAHFARTEGLQ